MATLAATLCSTRARCSSLPLNTGVVYPGRFLTRLSEESLEFLLELRADVVRMLELRRVGFGGDSVGIDENHGLAR